MALRAVRAQMGNCASLWNIGRTAAESIVINNMAFMMRSTAVPPFTTGAFKMGEKKSYISSLGNGLSFRQTVTSGGVT